MKKQIALLLPTRGRPHFMYRFIQSAFLLAHDKREIQVVFRLDDGDIPSLEAANDIKWMYDMFWGTDTVKVIVGPRVVLSELWNECYRQCNADILMHAGDDIIFRTYEWDKIVLNKFNEYPDKILFAYGADGHQPSTFGTHGFISRNWAETVGYFVPPYFSSDYNDTWLNEVSTRLGRHIYIHIYTEHMHPAAGKHIYDQTHIDRLERHKADNVDQLYRDYEPKRIEDAAKLQAFINTFTSNLYQ